MHELEQTVKLIDDKNQNHIAIIVIFHKRNKMSNSKFTRVIFNCNKSKHCSL